MKQPVSGLDWHSPNGQGSGTINAAAFLPPVSNALSEKKVFEISWFYGRLKKEADLQQVR
jgi:hypothetical protein